MKVKNIKNMTVTAMFAAVLAVVSQIAIPMPSNVPLTLQTFAVALIGCLLGSKKGAAAISVYILLGAAGLPVFANLKGGIGVLFGYTGGFLIGFIFMAVICGAGMNRNKAAGISLCLLGVVIDHIFGVAWFAIITENGILASALQVSVPYLIKDIISAAAAYFCAVLLRKRIKLNEE